MLIVPLLGDVIETISDIQYTVVGYSAYAKLPSALVEASGANTTLSVPFKEIKALNGTPVALTPGKILKAESVVTRKFQLPQVHDVVMVDGNIIKVKSLKLQERGDLTKGILIIGANEETDEQMKVRLFDIDRIIRANGNFEQSTNIMKKLYSEYLGSDS